MKFEGSALIENIVAMVIIGVILSMSGIVITHLYSSDSANLKLQAIIAVQNTLTSTDYTSPEKRFLIGHSQMIRDDQQAVKTAWAINGKGDTIYRASLIVQDNEN